MREIRTIIISVLIFSTVLVGMTSFYMDFAEEYGKTPENLATANATDRILEKSHEIESDLRETRGGIEGFAYLILDGVYQIVRLPLDFINIVLAMITDLSGLTPIAIPVWLSPLISGVIVITIVFGILSFIKGYRL